MAGLLGNFKNPLAAGGLLSDPMVRLQMGAAMMGGQTLGQQIGGGLQAAGVAKQAQQEAAKRNQTVEWLKSINPEIAQAVEMGALSGADGYKMAIEAQTPKTPDFQEVGGQLFNPATQEWITPPNQAPKPPEMQTLYDDRGAEYKAQWNPQTQNWEKVGGSKAGSNGITITNPDGTTTQIGGTAAKTTEADRRASLLAKQMQGSANDALKNFDTLATARNTGAAMGGMAGRAVMDPQAQVAKDAVTNVVANWLYLTSGATATPDEVRKQVEMTIPTAVDDEMTVAAKKARFKAIVDTMNERGGISAGGAPDPANVRKTQSGISFSAGQ